MLLTIEALGFFILAMTLMPRIHATSAAFWRIGRNVPSPVTKLSDRVAAVAAEQTRERDP
jgi:hypothetical protein